MLRGIQRDFEGMRVSSRSLGRGIDKFRRGENSPFDNILINKSHDCLKLVCNEARRALTRMGIFIPLWWSITADGITNAGSFGALLRRAGARTCEALVEAMGRAVEAATMSDTRGFFEHRGYRTPGQLL